jgi:hypothetical protein
MAAFDRDDRSFDQQHGRSYPMLGRDYTPAWIAGIVAVVAIVGVFTYESGYWGTHATSTHATSMTPTNDTTTPVVIPAPSEAPKR